MKKMIVSDYDNTIKTSSKYITSLNFKALKKFRENGNKLVIATGRAFSSIKKSLIHNKCEYDALICNSGSTIFDSNDNLIFGDEINNDDLNELIYYFRCMLKSPFDSVQLFDYNGLTDKRENIIEMVVDPNLLNNIPAILDELRNNYPHLCFYYYDFSIFVRKNCSKSDGINNIKNMFDIEDKDIYTIGDGPNDYEMIRDYNGYNVLFSSPKLYTVSKGTVLNVAHLVKKLENK